MKLQGDWGMFRVAGRWNNKVELAVSPSFVPHDRGVVVRHTQYSQDR